MSNLPGPPQPLYFAGAKILEVFQIGVVQGNVAVQVGALSYAGQLNLDIVADTNLVPDLTVFANGMTEDLERLGARAHEREPEAYPLIGARGGCSYPSSSGPAPSGSPWR